jgi:hypothetical protein
MKESEKTGGLDEVWAMNGREEGFRMHPSWQSQIKDHATRLRAFRTEYPEFFD